MIDPTTPSRRLKRIVLRAKPIWRRPGYVAWLYVMICHELRRSAKFSQSRLVYRSSAPSLRMRKGRKRGAILPIVEYGKQVSDAVELERRTHGLLKRFRVRGEWFRCSVSTATNAILCVTMAADEAGACKTRDEWIEEQAQALIIIWRSVRYIPRAMRPSVGKFREEREKKVREGGAPRDRRRFYQPWRARIRTR